MTWHDLTSYYILFTCVNFLSGFITLVYMLRCRLFLLFLEQHLEVLIFLIPFHYDPNVSGHSILGFETLCSKLISNMVTVLL